MTQEGDFVHRGAAPHPSPPNVPLPWILVNETELSLKLKASLGAARQLAARSLFWDSLSGIQPVELPPLWQDERKDMKKHVASFCHLRQRWTSSYNFIFLSPPLIVTRIWGAGGWLWGWLISFLQDRDIAIHTTWKRMHASPNGTEAKSIAPDPYVLSILVLLTNCFHYCKSLAPIFAPILLNSQQHSSQ